MSVRETVKEKKNKISKLKTIVCYGVARLFIDIRQFDIDNANICEVIYPPESPN